nr:AAA family ATPase [Saprospiraceae bacterium]
MIITHLYLLNYKQFLQLDLTFREGLVGIIGKNGAGKSTLFDAIIYCLFGKDEDEKQYIRNTSAPEKSTVTLALTFQIEEQLYRIKREFRGKDLVANAELYKNEVQIAKGLSEVNRQIIKLLNMEREAFKKSAFSGQKEISELADATREDRKKLIRKMMGLERLDIIRKKINEEKNILDNEVKMIIALLSDEKMLQDKQEVLLHTTNEIDRLINIKLTQEKALEQTKILSENNKNNFAAEEKNKIKFDTHFGNIEKFQSKIAEIEKGIANSTIQIENLIKLQHELKNIAPTIALFEKNQATLIAQQTAFTSFKNKEELLATQQLILDDLQKLDTKIQLLIEQVNIKQVLLQKIDNQQYTVNEYFEDEEKTRLELSMQVQQRGAIEGKILDIEHKLQQIKLLEENSDCPTCFRPLLEQYNVVVEHLSHELNISQTSALTTVNQMIEKYNQTIKTLVQKRNDAEKLLKESLNKLATIQSQENKLLIELEQQKILQQRHT